MIRRIAEKVILFCLICLLGISLYHIAERDRAYNLNQKIYAEIPSKDFEELRKINPDTVAWLTYEGTKIDYPVVQGDDNEKYLATAFNGDWSNYGTLFVDYICENPFEQFNTIIHGHHMFDGAMFGQLGRLKEEKYAKEHPKMELYVPGKAYELEVWAFLNSPPDSIVYATNLDDDDKDEYIEKVEDEAVYTIGEVTKDDKLVALSTCAYEYENARYIAVCKMKKVEPKEIVKKKEVKLPPIIYNWREIK